MTPQERQLIDDLFERLARVEAAPRDPDAVRAIADGQRRAPNALYALVQTVLVQDEALKRADARIRDLEGAPAGQQGQSGGFLDSMRDALFGGNAARGSVPSVRPPEPAQRPAWNTGQVLPQAGGYAQQNYPQPGYGPTGYGQPGYGQQPAGPFGGGGGSFLGTAAAAAAGVVGGSMLLGSIRSMMGGGHHQSFGDTAGAADSRSPWTGDNSSSGLAHDAGIDDIGRPHDTSDASRAGLFDQASNDGFDGDATDSGDFGGGGDGGGGDSDFA